MKAWEENVREDKVGPGVLGLWVVIDVTLTERYSIRGKGVIRNSHYRKAC